MAQVGTLGTSCSASKPPTAANAEWWVSAPRRQRPGEKGPVSTLQRSPRSCLPMAGPGLKAAEANELNRLNSPAVSRDSPASRTKSRMNIDHPACTDVHSKHCLAGFHRHRVDPNMVDEKSQIQALDRTQPGLPMKKGRCGTMTHDYKRHGKRRCSPLSTCSTARSPPP